MSTPKPGDKLNKQEVTNMIFRLVHQACSDPSNDYETLRDLFEASFGYKEDLNLRYLPSIDAFIVTEDSK